MNTMRVVFFIFLICFQQTCFSQEKNNEDSGDWIVTLGIGTATVEAADNFKINGTVSDVFFGKELLLGDSSSIITGVEVTRVKADFSNALNQQVFIINNHINVPVSYRMLHNREGKFSVFADLGMYASHLLKSKIEIESDDFDDSENSLGFNFGLQASFGAKYKFNDTNSISFNLKSKADLINSYKNSVQEFQLTDFYVFQLGLNFQL